MDEAQQLAYRLGHVAAAFVAGAAALGHADGGPELLLIKAELTADFAGSIFSMVFMVRSPYADVIGISRHTFMYDQVIELIV